VRASRGKVAAAWKVRSLTTTASDSGHEKIPGDGHEAARWRT
jgi:hypothetical protein